MMSAAVTGHYTEAGAEVEELVVAQDKEAVVAQNDLATEVLIQRRVVHGAPPSDVRELEEARGIDDGVGPAQVGWSLKCEAQSEYELSGRI
ncbi:hypothetical protein CMUS01_09979 [Colletotrichum musicola]|uniref:Uncharacterized protein n=1 Tax=Colletotrichum musicola TaxID=2175873 RepID=A0A8H6K5Z9_9PEZI|nr:hypothetical protein CMUS01_09979 [Colletotrichum musicola]